MPVAVVLLAAALMSRTEPMITPQPESPIVKPRFELAQPFPLADVHLTDGPFEVANEVCAKYLLTVDPDRLLHSFLVHSGLPAKGKLYGGWEDSGLAGHSLGHYLTACAQQYASTGDKRFKDKIDYIVSELVRCQKNRMDGYISAIPNGDEKWAQIKRGEITSGGFDLNGMWSPWYTNHKVLAGLVDAYELADNRDALQVASKFADWAIEETKELTDAQWQKMLGCEYGGMNDVLASIYQLTGQKKYLDLAEKFYDHRVLDPLADQKDDLAGKHSNTQIPKIIGLANLYELTGNDRDKQAASFFWDAVVNHHTYAIGGNSNHEYFGPADKLRDSLSSNTCETCNTYNMLKLTRHLFEWAPDAKYADYYERAHFNHILGSQDPDDGMMTYFMPLGSGESRQYSDPYDNWTCCHGTGMENHTKHADSVYFHSGSQKLYVNQFIATELNWKEAGVKLKQETDFPNSGKVALTIEKGGRSFELLIRHPGWAKGPVQVTLNGHVVATSETPSSYIQIHHAFRSGDRVEFTLPMSLYTESMPDDPKRVAVLYGPIVLSADLGGVDQPKPRTPVLVTGGEDPSAWLEQEPGKDLVFKTKGVGRPEDLTFRPFWTLHQDRYATYFDEFSQPQWEASEAEYRAEEARQKDLEARTIDFMRIGEMQPERDHELKSERNDVRDANGRNFRTPLGNGWFEFTMKVDGSGANELVMTYWGNERAQEHRFDILIDGQPFVTETLPDKKSNAFFDETHAIPSTFTSGKSTIVIRVQGIEGSSAGSVAGARIVHAKA